MANDPSVSWFPLGDEERLAPEIRALYAKCRERIGFVPNVFRAYQWLPERLEAFIAHYDAVMAPTETLTAADREMIAVTVSMLNGCAYCLVSHGYAVRRATKDPVLGDLVTFDHRRAPVTERQHAILRYVEKVTRTPLDCSQADLAELRGHGLSDRDLWDVAEVASLFNFTNRLALATGMAPNAEYHAMAR